MNEEKSQKMKHWTKNILLCLLVTVGALIAKDIYDYIKLSTDAPKNTSAAQQGHKEIVELLLKNGADINTRETSGKTALSEADRNEHAAIINLLKERGAN